MQGVVFTQLYLHLEFGQMNSVVEQLTGTVETRNHPSHARAERWLQADGSGVEGAEELCHGVL
ncbi:hypothetical protein D3C80_2175770 [compost metagenome]